MSDNEKEHTPNRCEFCSLTQKAFGDRFKICADISSKLAEKALKAMKLEMTSLIGEVIDKSSKGELSKDELKEVKTLIESSFPFAASIVPALAISEGADASPVEMKKLVEINLLAMIQRKMEIQTGLKGPAAILAAFLNLAPPPEDPKPLEPEAKPAKPDKKLN